MLTDLCMALVNHLSTLGAPVYLADCVPEGASFPYVTLDFAPSLDLCAEGTLAVTAWAAGDTANADRLVLAGDVLRLLPARGIRLASPTGAALIRQKGGVACVRESEARGVRMVYRVQAIPEKGETP